MIIETSGSFDHLEDKSCKKIVGNNLEKEKQLAETLKLFGSFRREITNQETYEAARDCVDCCYLGEVHDAALIWLVFATCKQCSSQAQQIIGFSFSKEETKELFKKINGEDQGSPKQNHAYMHEAWLTS